MVKPKIVKMGNDSILHIHVMKNNKRIANLLIFSDGAISVLSSEIKTEYAIIRHFGNPIKEL